MALSGHYQQAPAAEQPSCRLELEKHLVKLEELAAACPENFLHKHALLAAETARLNGDIAAAEEQYQKAINSAAVNGYLQNEALANELMSRFFLDRGLESAAAGYLQAAQSCYERWGAAGKVAHMRKLYPQLNRKPLEAEPLDIMAVFKAARAIAAETTLENVLQTLMQVVVESSGAQRGVLVLEDQNQLMVRAHGPHFDRSGRSDIDTGRIAVTEIPLASYDDAPNTVLNYVWRAQEPIVLHNAVREGVFISDPYIKAQGIRSVLCLPIIKQERLMGVLYLENNLVPSCFTPARLELMQLLASQIVTALENGMLLAALERELSQRTRAEETLRLSEQALQAVFELADVAMVEIDLTTHQIVRANAKFCLMLGYTCAELLDRKTEDIMAPNSNGDNTQLWSQFHNAGSNTMVLNQRYRNKSGQLISTQVNATVVPSNNGSPALAIAVVKETPFQEPRTGEQSLNKAFGESNNAETPTF